MTEDDARTDPLTALFRPGERLGWVFRDRRLFLHRYPEPSPRYHGPPPELDQRERSARNKRSASMTTGWVVGGIAVAVFACCTAMMWLGLTDGGERALASGFFGFLMLLTALTVGAWFGLTRSLYTRRVSSVEVARFEHRRGFDHALAQWAARKEEFDRREWARVGQLMEWGAATPPADTHRVDIVGGNAWGWEAVLTIYGGSLLASRAPVLLVDLTGEAVCRELIRLAQTTGTSVDVQLLPDDLSDSDLLAGLDPRQVVDTLVESMYGDADTAARADRAMDERILSALCQALGGAVSIGRLAAGLRVLMGEPGERPELTAEERRRIADDLFSDEYRRQAHTHLRRMESHLHPLEALGTGLSSRPKARLSCLAMAADGRNVRNELLNDLIVQWLTRRMLADGEPARTLIIAGADELARRHTERLSEICERRGVRLVWLSRHLRGSAVQVLGARTVAFMRLANHEEARQAADFIGRQHRFTLTQLTRSLGGNETHSVADSTGGSETDGWNFGGNSSSFGGSSGSGSSWGRSLSVSRSWNQTVSVANGTNWNDATTHQRVYEYTVEPRTLQDLPDYAMLLVTWGPNGSTVQPVECNPDIVTMPRATLDPLPHLPLPGPNAATDATWAAAPVSLGEPVSEPSRGGR